MPYDPRLAQMGMNMLNGPTNRNPAPTDDQMLQDAQRDPMQDAFSAAAAMRPRTQQGYPGQPGQQRQVSLLDMLSGRGGNLYPLGTTAPHGGSGAIRNPWQYV